ncbi:MAG: hypothetical protein WC814_02680 [Candidatus Paceibacterota bacterium]|jgi:hypothetical protein
MSKIIAVLALAIATLAVPVASVAATWKPFFRGINNPAELEGKIEASLAKNPKGTSMLDPERCKRDGSCATPLNYLEALKQVDPGAHLTSVAQVPGFLRTLQVIDAPVGEYWISCLKPSGRGTYRAVLHCLSRSFKKGEKAWVDPKTNKIVFASDCTNPVEKPVKEECVYIPFITKSVNTVVRFAAVGPADIRKDDDCLAVKAAGDTEFERWWADKCASVYCDFSAPAAVVGQRILVIGSYEPKPGEHILRLPKYFAEKGSLFVTLLCIENTKMTWPELPNQSASREQIAEWIAGHSDTIGVRWHDYRVTQSGRREARVFYTKADVPPGLSVSQSELYWHWGEWARMQAR